MLVAKCVDQVVLDGNCACWVVLVRLRIIKPIQLWPDTSYNLARMIDARYHFHESSHARHILYNSSRARRKWSERFVPPVMATRAILAYLDTLSNTECRLCFLSNFTHPPPLDRARKGSFFTQVVSHKAVQVWSCLYITERSKITVPTGFNKN